MTVIRSAIRSVIFSPIRQPTTLYKGGGAAPVLTPLEILTSKGLPFFLHDFVSRTDLTFQATTTVTPADDSGEAVAMALGIDQIGTGTIAESLVGQTQLLGNPGFDTDTVWAKENGATISGGRGVFSGGVSERLRQDVLTIGKIYSAGVEVITGGPFNIQIGGVVGPATAVGGNAFASLASAVLFGLRGATGTGTVDNASVREIPGYHAVQSGSTSFRPTRQAIGVKGDALDDFLRSRLTASASADTLLIDCDVPASISAFGAAVGVNGSGGTSRLFVGFDTAGLLAGGVGTQSISTIKGATDYRGTRVQAALAFGSSQVRLRAGGANVYGPAASAGAPDTANAFDLFSVNGNGTAGSFGGVTLRRAAAIQADLSDTEIDSILAQWGAS